MSPDDNYIIAFLANDGWLFKPDINDSEAVLIQRILKIDGWMDPVYNPDITRVRMDNWSHTLIWDARFYFTGHWEQNRLVWTVTDSVCPVESVTQKQRRTFINEAIDTLLSLICIPLARRKYLREQLAEIAEATYALHQI